MMSRVNKLVFKIASKAFMFRARMEVSRGRFYPKSPALAAKIVAKNQENPLKARKYWGC